MSFLVRCLVCLSVALAAPLELAGCNTVEPSGAPGVAFEPETRCPTSPVPDRADGWVSDAGAGNGDAGKDAGAGDAAGGDGGPGDDVPLPEDDASVDAGPPPDLMQDVTVTRTADALRIRLEGAYARDLYHTMGFVVRNPFGEEGSNKRRTGDGIRCNFYSSISFARCDLELPPGTEVRFEDDTL